jgi:hypothetical protein
MSFEKVNLVTMPAATAQALRARFVTVGANGVVYTAQNAAADGILMEDSLAGTVDVVSMAVMDGSKNEMTASASISVGDRIAVSTDGKGKTAGAGQASMGVALTAAAGNDSVFTMFCQTLAADI